MLILYLCLEVYSCHLFLSYQIFWLTARKKHLFDVTKDWLLENKFPIDQLIFVELFNDKIPHLVSIQPALFIDDLKYDYYSLEPKRATKMIKQLKENDINFIEFNYDWEEILKLLPL